MKVYILAAVISLIGIFFSWIAAFILTGILVLGYSLASCIYENKIDPPKNLVRTTFGKAEDFLFGFMKAKLVGGQWYILLPVIQAINEIDARSVTEKVPDVDIFTPEDSIQSKVEGISVGFKADSKNPTVYFQMGGKEGITKRLIAIVTQEVRQWGSNPNQPPKTWKEAQSAQEDLMNDLRKKIRKECGENEDSDVLTRLGIILETVTVAKITPMDIKVIETAAQPSIEEAQRKTELYEAETETQVAELLRKSLSISREKAYCLMKDYKAIHDGKGIVLRLSNADAMAKTITNWFTKQSLGLPVSPDVGGTK